MINGKDYYKNIANEITKITGIKNRIEDIDKYKYDGTAITLIIDFDLDNSKLVLRNSRSLMFEYADSEHRLKKIIKRQNNDDARFIREVSEFCIRTEREQINKLRAEKEEIEKQLKKLTSFDKKSTYSQKLKDLIYEYIRNKKAYYSRYQEHAMYEKLRGNISKRLGVKTQTYSKHEYIDALKIIQNEWNYKIDEQYLVPNIDLNEWGK